MFVVRKSSNSVATSHLKIENVTEEQHSGRYYCTFNETISNSVDVHILPFSSNSIEGIF